MAVCFVGKLGFSDTTPCVVYSLPNHLAALLAQALGNQDAGAKNKDVLPSWLGATGVIFNILFTIVITQLDVALVTWLDDNHWSDNLLTKILSGLMIAASVLTNFWMIH